MTNIESDNCRNLKIDDVNISNDTDFGLSPSNPKGNIKPEDCSGGKKFIDFMVENMSPVCTSTSTLVTIKIKNQTDFTFTLVINSFPIISVLGGSPLADVINGSTNTTAANGTFFGVVTTGDSITRRFFITNTGSCPLGLSSITSSVGDYSVTTPVGPMPPGFFAVAPGNSFFFDVNFLAPAATGTFVSTISILSTDTSASPYTFNVSADIFNFNIPGPGGITADFRLWLKSTRGVVQTASKVSKWTDIGTNGKDAEQTTSVNQPTFLDDAASNINFNPVIKFENDGSTLNQYLYNTINGFYSQEIFIVMEPDVDVSGSPGMAIFSGTVASSTSPENYIDDAEDVTGVGLGDFTTNLTGERLWYNQGSSSPSKPFYSLPASSARAYDKAGIINVHNKTLTASDGMSILFNTVDDAMVTTKNITTFENLGSVDTVPDPDVVLGTPYMIGKNANSIFGNLNGRVAEIFTFAERVPAVDRQKIESYLAIKYGITIGSSSQAEKDYVNSFNTKVWDIVANAGFNYHVAGIGRDSISDLNQKQSKTINTSNEVTIGLGGIFSKNSINSNEFNNDGDFLVWGSDNGAYSGTGTNTITIAPGITTSLTRIDRKWKIVESKEDLINGDVETVFVGIPAVAFSSFPKNADEEYALIVADNANFADGGIIDVIPLKSDGGLNLQTWYDFDGTKYFTFGKTPKLTGNRSVSVASGDYLVGEYALNLNIDGFSVSAWVKSVPIPNNRTIASKGEKLQMRINTQNEVEVFMDEIVVTTSNMKISDAKWHHIAFVYESGTVFLYIDGVLDKSVQNIEPPTPNFNRFSIGAVYKSKNDVVNPFLGEIDEFSIWDQALSENQVRYLMNQEIERSNISGTDYVKGKILPQASASNEIANIPWSKLKAYYDFNSFYGSTVEGLTDARNFLRLKYLVKDKSIVDIQTAPLPYVSVADGEWGSPAIWSNSTFQNLPNALSLDGATFVDWNIVETTHNITSGDRNITVLGLKNILGKITIADPVDPQDETNSGQGLTITHYLELDGVIDLVGESQLVQTEGSILDEDSGGYIERDQQGTANSFNYNYWSSSAGPIRGNSSTRGTGISSTNSNYSISSVLFDGTGSSSYLPISFNSSSSAADSNTPTSPRTISTRWMFKFYGATTDFNAWSPINEISPLLPGEGFTMKGTSGAVNILTSFQNYVFKGTPNNGNITLPLTKNVTAQNPTGDVDRLVGNPYPSAIDAIEFILDNLSVADGGNNPTGTVINGALYFWDHFGEQNSHKLSDYVGGYATYNLTGGVAAISNDSRINNTSNAGGPATGTKVPGQYIPVNQGFFVSTTPNGFVNDNGIPISSVAGGELVFKNSQRVFVPEAIAISVFTRAPNRAASTRIDTNENNEIKGGRSLIRLIYDSPTGFHRQIAIGTNEKATDGFDIGYDAFIADINEEDMYWAFGSGKFVIQGVNNFNGDQEFPLGLVVKEAGLVRIKIDALEGISSNFPIYIKDKFSGKTSLINDEPFKLFLEPGEYNSRFCLTFQSQTNTAIVPESLVETELSQDDDLSIKYDENSSELNINLKDKYQDYQRVSLFNIMGQKLYTVEISSRNIAIPVKNKTNFYILRFETNETVFSKKISID